MSIEREAVRIAKENGAVCIYPRPEWNGHPVFFMSFVSPGEEIPCIGIPSFIVFIGGKPRVMDDAEAMAYMRYMRSLMGDEDDEEAEEMFDNEYDKPILLSRN